MGYDMFRKLRIGSGCCTGARVRLSAGASPALLLLVAHLQQRSKLPSVFRLQAFDQYLHDMTVKLNRKVEDLDDVRHVMEVLREVRETEANIHTLITPIDDMYSLLLRWVRVLAGKPCSQTAGPDLTVHFVQVGGDLGGDPASARIQCSNCRGGRL